MLRVSNVSIVRVDHLAIEPWPRDRSKTPLAPQTRLGDLALFNLAIDSNLRGCDRVRLMVTDVYTAGNIKERTSIFQRKTGKPVQFEISEQTRKSLMDWIAHPRMQGYAFLFPSRFHESDRISTRQYARAVKTWVTSIGLEPNGYGTHSMRRTKVAEIYRKTGNLRAVQLLLGHTKMDSTVRYLCVELEDALSIPKGSRFSVTSGHP
tara:strand:+ start:6029 stop:6649 length:621 start_codon:yes stop_codon:yes gene_type:complete